MPLTNAEKQARYRAKQKLIGISTGPGGVDRLSELVHEQVRKMVAAGELVPTIKDGLTAERIIEAREKQQDDRKMAIALARLLAGGGQLVAPVTLIEDGLVIDGEATEIPNE